MTTASAKRGGGAALTRQDTQSARLVLPRPALANCIVLSVIRDTRGRELPHHDRFNYFPTAPHCGLSWCFEGQTYVVKNAAEAKDPGAGAPIPRLLVSGPSRGPTMSWNPGPVFAMTIGFYSDAWKALTGVDASDLIDTNLPAEDLLPDDLIEIAHSVFNHADDDCRLEQFEQALLPIWNSRRPENRIAPSWFRDWVVALTMLAAGSEAGRSARQVQRRIKTWTGLSQRELKAIARGEELFATLSAQRAKQADVDLSQLAAETGFSDQSHMGREVRRITGTSPARFNRLIETEESYWFYRLLRERFS